jgi:hypothetical protein
MHDEKPIVPVNLGLIRLIQLIRVENDQNQLTRVHRLKYQSIAMQTECINQSTGQRTIKQSSRGVNR